MPFRNLGKFLEALKKAGDLHVVREPVDPEYEVGETEALNDVRAFLDELHSHGMLAGEAR